MQQQTRATNEDDPDQWQDGAPNATVDWVNGGVPRIIVPEDALHRAIFE